MKQYFVALALLMLAAGLSARPAVAQDTGTVTGVCKDLDGKPIVGAQVEWLNTETGRKFYIKTNSKGQYYSLGITPGKYTVTLSKDGKEIFHFNGFTVALADNTLDFDLQKERAAQAQGEGLTPEELKRQQELQAKIAKETATVKTLNEKLALAKTAYDAGDFDTAIAQVTEATQMEPTRDLLWNYLGDYTLASAGKQTDSAEKAKRYEAAIADYQKVLELKQNAPETDSKKAADTTKRLASLYNNMGKAEAQLGKTDDAVKAYNQAVQLDPAGAGMYYFNLGAILTNANTKSDPEMRKAAVDAFDKAIAADPTKADAYYWKGTNLIGAATLQGDKMIAPAGTAEAFQKYLELQPTGSHAEEAKAMLQGLGATVETSFGASKKKTTKK